MTPTRIAQDRVMYDAGEHSVQQIADTFGVSRPTIYRHLAERGGRRRPAGEVEPGGRR